MFCGEGYFSGSPTRQNTGGDGQSGEESAGGVNEQGEVYERVPNSVGNEVLYLLGSYMPTALYLPSLFGGVFLSTRTGINFIT